MSLPKVLPDVIPYQSILDARRRIAGKVLRIPLIPLNIDWPGGKVCIHFMLQVRLIKTLVGTHSLPAIKNSDLLKYEKHLKFCLEKYDRFIGIYFFDYPHCRSMHVFDQYFYHIPYRTTFLNMQNLLTRKYVTRGP